MQSPPQPPQLAADVELLAAVRAAEFEIPAASRVRHSERVSAGVSEPRFSDSEHSARDHDYDAQRIGSRHARARETRYPEAVQQITELTLQSQAWLHDSRGTLPTRVGLARWVTQ